MGGQPYSSNVPVETGALSLPAALFQTGRAGNVQYLFYNRPQRTGLWYDVRLYFAESTFHEAGKRRFDVEINGRKVLQDFDIFQEAGGANKAVMKEFPAISANRDGTFEIKLETGSADAPGDLCDRIDQSRSPAAAVLAPAHGGADKSARNAGEIDGDQLLPPTTP